MDRKGDRPLSEQNSRQATGKNTTLGSQLEGLIGFCCFAAVGGFIAQFVARSDTLWVLIPFTYIGLHILFAGIAAVPLAIVVAMLKIEEPPFSFLVSLSTVVVIPAIAAVLVIVSTVCHFPDSGFTRGLAGFGAIVSPFVLVGVGGSMVEAYATRDKIK
jgi:hypothetical protein